VHPELTSRAGDDRSRQTAVGVRGADEELDVLEAETGLERGRGRLAQAAAAADPGVEEDDAAVGGAVYAFPRAARPAKGAAAAVARLREASSPSAAPPAVWAPRSSGPILAVNRLG
jgi:hypothetical protein